MVGAIMFGACSDWLEVTPKTEVKSEDNFENEQGFKDAINGVYMLLNEPALYGRELTFGMLDVLAQYYRNSTPGEYQYDRTFEFTQSAPKARLAGVWGTMYKAIANLNELIAHIDKADRTMFTGDTYRLIRGEAYGLRAMLHFDLVRMFGPSYKVGADTRAIPYIRSVGSTPAPLSTVSEVCVEALEDLAVASEMLEGDPVLEGTTVGEDYARNRHFKFNYYAAVMLEARIQLYTGNHTAANSAAQEIMAQQTFHWTPAGEITTSSSTDRNKIFSDELVFSLHGSTEDMDLQYTDYFMTTDGLAGLIIPSTSWSNGYAGLFDIYEYGSTDYRYVYQSVDVGSTRYSIKLQQGGSNANRIPVMRISEAYYIAAECALYGSAPNIAAAVGYLNDVRRIRNIIEDLPGTLTADEVREELRKEYAKEFINEGQLFYFYKRLDYTSIPYHYQSYDDWNGVVTIYKYVDNTTPFYVLPLPDDEIDYGGREME